MSKEANQHAYSYTPPSLHTHTENVSRCVPQTSSTRQMDPGALVRRIRKRRELCIVSKWMKAAVRRGNPFREKKKKKQLTTKNSSMEMYLQKYIILEISRIFFHSMEHENTLFWQFSNTQGSFPIWNCSLSLFLFKSGSFSWTHWDQAQKRWHFYTIQGNSLNSQRLLSSTLKCE